jgi:DNA polymerase-3 subunit epsilon/CBS domain-containing protein
VKSIATFPLESVSERDFLYIAFGRMRRKKYRHMGVVNSQGELVGAITQRDLLRLQADEALAFSDALGEAVSTEELALVWRKLANAARSLLHEEVDARDIAGIWAKCAALPHAPRPGGTEVSAAFPNPNPAFAVMKGRRPR